MGGSKGDMVKVEQAFININKKGCRNLQPGK